MSHLSGFLKLAICFFIFVFRITIPFIDGVYPHTITRIYLNIMGKKIIGYFWSSNQHHKKNRMEAVPFLA